MSFEQINELEEFQEQKKHAFGDNKLHIVYSKNDIKQSQSNISFLEVEDDFN